MEGEDAAIKIEAFPFIMEQPQPESKYRHIDK
jgi:hypothetical protein